MTTRKTVKLFLRGSLRASGPVGGNPRFYVVTLPAHGNLLGDPPILEFTPEANYSGTDHFLYLVVNDNGASNLGVITIEVRSAPDPPVAYSAEITVFQDSRGNTLNLLAVDPDADADVTLRIRAEIT